MKKGNKSIIISTRVDEETKKDFITICDDIGLSASGAFNLFMRAVIREKGIPFEIKKKD